jgi:hypothetical protein
MGVVWEISHGFSSGELDLSARPQVATVGWAALPETMLGNELKSKGADDGRIRLVLTFLAAMDRARDAVALWDKGLKLHSVAPWAFTPADVVDRSLTELADVLLNTGVSQRHLADSAAWRRIAESLYSSPPDRPVRRAIEQGAGAAGALLGDLSSKAPGGSALFPFLNGPKIGPMWIRMLVAPGNASITELQIIPVAVDVQVRRISENLGVTETSGQSLEAARPVIQAAWRQLAESDKIDAPGSLSGTCAGLDPALWFFAKYGCMECEKHEHRVPIHPVCSKCRLPDGPTAIPAAISARNEFRKIQTSKPESLNEDPLGQVIAHRPLIGLVGCVKSKLDHAAPARDLYLSTLFAGRRRDVEDRADRRFIISAEYGMVEPDEWIEPYDTNLGDFSVAERRMWASKVLSSLRTTLGDLAKYRFEIHAGANYFDFGLADGLRAAGANVVTPTSILRRGEQLNYYNKSGDAPASPGGHGAPRGRYSVIWDLLDSAETPEVRLSLHEIEELTGVPLPPSARKYQAWWYGRSLPWTKRGWTTRPRLPEGYVIFRHRGDNAELSRRRRDAGLSMTPEQMNLQEDWIKTVGWDFPHEWQPFLDAVAGGFPYNQQVEVIRDMQRLPMWRAAPQSIQRGAALFLSQGRDDAKPDNREIYLAELRLLPYRTLACEYVLDRAPEKTWRPVEVWAECNAAGRPDDTKELIQVTMADLYQRERIDRPSWGHYQSRRRPWWPCRNLASS